MERQFEKMVDYIQGRCVEKPFLGIILGSGLGHLAQNLENKITIPYQEIAGYPLPTVKGHQGEFVLGSYHGTPVMAAKGRFHFYEGHDIEKITLPVRIFSSLGVKQVIVTNAAGSTHPDINPGSLMVIKGHVDGTFRNSHSKPALNTAPGCHDPDMIKNLYKVAADIGLELKEGVYCWTQGPGYETPAEIEYFKGIGCTAVGMSTVPELEKAGEIGLKTMGISLITNFAAGISTMPLTHEEVIDMANETKELFTQLILKYIEHIND